MDAITAGNTSLTRRNMAATLGSVLAPDKANGLTVRPSTAYQRGRQGALRGYGKQLAARCRISYATLQHELDDLARDPVAKVATRVRAMREEGCASERVYLYLHEIHEAVAPITLASCLKSAALVESVTDADENVVGDRAILNGLTANDRRAWVEQIDRNMAAERALRAALVAE